VDGGLKWIREGERNWEGSGRRKEETKELGVEWKEERKENRRRSFSTFYETLCYYGLSLRNKNSYYGPGNHPTDGPDGRTEQASERTKRRKDERRRKEALKQLNNRATVQLS